MDTPILDPALVAILACPADDNRPPLRLEGQTLVCDQCRRIYRIEEGIPILLPEEATMPARKEISMQLTRTNAPQVAVIHGPNLNMLGVRDPDIYGTDNFDTVNQRIQSHADVLGVGIRITHSNSEGVLIDTIQDSMSWANAIIINPGAYTHYSYAIRDALTDTRLPVIEVHVSNIHTREDFRRTSVISPAVTGQIVGFGTRSYLLALDAIKSLLEESHR